MISTEKADAGMDIPFLGNTSPQNNPGPRFPDAPKAPTQKQPPTKKQTHPIKKQASPGRKQAPPAQRQAVPHVIPHGQPNVVHVTKTKTQIVFPKPNVSVPKVAPAQDSDFFFFQFMQNSLSSGGLYRNSPHMVQRGRLWLNSRSMRKEISTNMASMVIGDIKTRETIMVHITMAKLFTKADLTMTDQKVLTTSKAVAGHRMVPMVFTTSRVAVGRRTKALTTSKVTAGPTVPSTTKMLPIQAKKMALPIGKMAPPIKNLTKKGSRPSMKPAKMGRLTKKPTVAKRWAK